MSRRWMVVAAAGILVLMAALLRLQAVVAEPSLEADLSSVRDAVVDRLADTEAGDLRSGRLQSLGIEQIDFQIFDPNAVVIIRPGEDGQPGVAGVDDNGNGVVDDKSELGATSSDDVCLVAAPDKLDSEQPTLVLQKGAFVPASWQQVRGSDQNARAIVHGRSRGERWSFLVELAQGGNGLEGQL